MTVTAITHRARVGALGAVVVAVAAGSAGWQLRSHESQQPSAPAATAPSWFQPIADYYRNNPHITPQFDFASVYGGRLPNSRR
jgi:hypothetical protein